MFFLPMPPTLSACFTNVPGRGRVKTATYEAWIKIAGYKLKAQRPLQFLGDVEVGFRLGPRNRRSDLDNHLKALCDILVKHRVIKDDNRIVKLTAEWFDGIRGVEVTVQGIQGELRPRPSRRTRPPEAAAEVGAG